MIEFRKNRMGIDYVELNFDSQCTDNDISVLEQNILSKHFEKTGEQIKSINDLLTEKEKRLLNYYKAFVLAKIYNDRSYGPEADYEVSLPIYAVTVMEKIEEFVYETGVHSGFPEFGDRRTWGFYFNKDFAIEAVKNNSTDIQEHLYNYAVIEKYEPSICAMATERLWFKWDKEKKEFYEIPEPKEPIDMKHFCNFAFG